MFRIVFNFSALNYLCHKTPPESIILVTTDNGSKNLELEGDIKKCLKKNKHRLFIILNPRVSSLYCFFNFRRKKNIYHFGAQTSNQVSGWALAEVPGSSFFDSDSGSQTVQSRNSVPITIPRLSMARTRFQIRFRDCTGFELDSDSGSETAQT